MANPKDFGAALKAVRARRGVSQIDAARAAGLSLTVLNRAETGKSFPSVESLLAVLDAVGADLHDLADAMLERRTGQRVERGTPRAAWVSVLVRHGVDPRALEGAAADALAGGDPKAEADLFASAEEAARQLTAAAVAELRRVSPSLAKKD